MEIVPLSHEHHEGIIELSKKLRVKEDGSGWFLDEATNETIPVDIKIQRGYVALEEDDVVGFITYFSEYGEPKIGWMGVHPEHHREGIGEDLLKEVEEDVKEAGADELYVETPTKEEGLDSDYERTYLFYESMGFTVNKTFEGQSCEMVLLKKELE